jgi:hypothetical protein
MSDAKPRRAGRESGRGEIIAGDAAPVQPAPLPAPTPVPDDVAGVTASAAAAAAPPVIGYERAAPAAAESVEPAVAAAADETWTFVVEMQQAFARGCEEIAVEMTGIAQSGIAAASNAATAMLAARTFAEAVEINAGLIQRNADAMLASGARLSEIGVKAVTEASRPVLAHLANTWSSGGLT